MEIDWNLTDDVLNPKPPAHLTDADAAREKLEKEMAGWVAAGPPAPPKVEEQKDTESQDSPPPTESQDSTPDAPSLYGEAHIQAVYQVQAMRGELLDKLAERIIASVTMDRKGTRPDMALLSCALGRAFVVLSPNLSLIAASHDIESSAIPGAGDRVQEDNGATGTVVSILSLTEAIVKWDHEPRAIRSSLQFIKKLPDGRRERG